MKLYHFRIIAIAMVVAIAVYPPPASSQQRPGTARSAAPGAARSVAPARSASPGAARQASVGATRRTINRSGTSAVSSTPGAAGSSGLNARPGTNDCPMDVVIEMKQETSGAVYNRARNTRCNMPANAEVLPMPEGRDVPDWVAPRDAVVINCISGYASAASRVCVDESLICPIGSVIEISSNKHFSLNWGERQECALPLNAIARRLVAGETIPDDIAQAQAHMVECTAGRKSLGTFRCTACSGEGKYCAPGAASEVDCPAGRFCPNVATSNPCPAGRYCPVGTMVPIDCPSSHVCPAETAMYNDSMLVESVMIEQLKNMNLRIRASVSSVGSIAVHTDLAPHAHGANTDPWGNPYIARRGVTCIEMGVLRLNQERCNHLWERRATFSTQLGLTCGGAGGSVRINGWDTNENSRHGVCHNDNDNRIMFYLPHF